MKLQQLVMNVTRQPRDESRLLAALRQVRRWKTLHDQRRQLAALSDAMLKDIGLSRADVEREAGRPFWDDPRRH